MAISKKGWRRLCVDDAKYFWRVQVSDWGTSVLIAGPAAFISGQSGQQLVFTLDFNNDWVSRSAVMAGTEKRPAVTPGLVRFALERGRAAKPPFTGEAGLPHVILSPDDRAEAWRLAKEASPD